MLHKFEEGALFVNCYMRAHAGPYHIVGALAVGWPSAALLCVPIGRLLALDAAMHTIHVTTCNGEVLASWVLPLSSQPRRMTCTTGHGYPRHSR